MQLQEFFDFVVLVNFFRLDAGAAAGRHAKSKIPPIRASFQLAESLSREPGFFIAELDEGSGGRIASRHGATLLRRFAGVFFLAELGWGGSAK